MSGVIKAASMTAVFLMATFIATAGYCGVDWHKIHTTTMVLIYPGTASWEFVHSDDHRLGKHGIMRKKKGCRRCHLSKEGELDLKADEIAAGTLKMKRSQKPFEPKPIPGKKGTITANLQAAYNTKYLYIRVEWDAKGSAWKSKNRKVTPDRVTLQINKKNEFFKRYGCFISCHNDLYTMPSSPSKEKVRSNPYYSALGRNDVRLYAFYAGDSWAKKKGTKELEKIIAGGGLIDLWSVKLSSGTAKPLDGWILEDRRWEKSPDVRGTGEWLNGKYTVVFKRKLKATGSRDISMKEGDIISAGLAIHDDGAKKRQHYVSFPFTIGLGKASIVRAVKVPD